LVMSPWTDSEHLFTAGQDYLSARDGEEMIQRLHELRTSEERGRAIATHGLATIRRRHTCVHRVDELLRIFYQLRKDPDGDVGSLELEGESARV
jgi:spore maturation protein CgeB